MPKRIMKSILWIFVISQLFTVLPMAQDFNVGEIEFDRYEWGNRKIFIPVDNARDDTVRVHIIVQTLYPRHYLSGLEHPEIDTTIVLEPKGMDDIIIPFSMHGSFGRIVTRVMVYWKFDNYVPEKVTPDSTFQIFNNVFVVKGEGSVYTGKKHAIGPVYSVMDHYLMNFEYPRLVLFLMGQGEAPAKISTLFEADMSYTQDLIRDFRADGFFPVADDSLAPGILAITEGKGYDIKAEIKAASEAFSKWYDEKGRNDLGRILAEAGIDDFSAGLPALQMPILHHLLMKNWIENPSDLDLMHFEDMEKDLRTYNQPRWIVQGGEFFLPKLCLGAFAESGDVYFATFSPDPSLPFDKAPIFNMRKEVENGGEAIDVIGTDQIRRVLNEGTAKNLTKEPAAQIKPIIAAAEKKLEKFRPYQEPYLADYVIRVVLGEYFIKHLPAEGLDCVKVRYQP